MSSAHVAIRGLSPSSVSQALDSTEIPSAIRMNRRAELMPPYCSPLPILIISESFHIFSSGVCTIYNRKLPISG